MGCCLSSHQDHEEGSVSASVGASNSCPETPVELTDTTVASEEEEEEESMKPRARRRTKPKAKNTHVTQETSLVTTQMASGPSLASEGQEYHDEDLDDVKNDKPPNVRVIRFNLEEHYHDIVRLGRQCLQLSEEFWSPMLFHCRKVECCVAISFYDQMEKDYDVIGFILAYPHPNSAPYPDSVWQIGFLCVDPRYDCGPVVAGLLNAIFERVNPPHVPSRRGIGVYAPVYHHKAQRMYESLGFVKIAKIGNYYSTDTLLFEHLYGETWKEELATRTRAGSNASTGSASALKRDAFLYCKGNLSHMRLLLGLEYFSFKKWHKEREKEKEKENDERKGDISRDREKRNAAPKILEEYLQSRIEESRSSRRQRARRNTPQHSPHVAHGHSPHVNHHTSPHYYSPNGRHSRRVASPKIGSYPAKLHRVPSAERPQGSPSPRHGRNSSPHHGGAYSAQNGQYGHSGHGGHVAHTGHSGHAVYDRERLSSGAPRLLTTAGTRSHANTHSHAFRRSDADFDSHRASHPDNRPNPNSYRGTYF